MLLMSLCELCGGGGGCQTGVWLVVGVEGVGWFNTLAINFSKTSSYRFHSQNLIHRELNSAVYKYSDSFTLALYSGFEMKLILKYFRMYFEGVYIHIWWTIYRGNNEKQKKTSYYAWQYM